MQATYVQHNNPLCVHRDTDTSVIAAGQTINEVLLSKGLIEDIDGRFLRNGPFVPFLNGQPVLESHWNTVIGENDVMQVCRMPKGGGGGGSNFGAILGGVLAAVLAYFTFGASLLVAAAVGVGIAAGMSLLTGAVPKPYSSSLSGSAGASPTYSLEAQSNQARLLQAIPRIYGTMRVTPDLAAQPYSEFINNEQVLYQLFAVSLGSVDIDQIIVDETDIDSFEDATYQIVKPGEKVTLFPANVITSDSVQTITMPTPGSVDNNIIGPYTISQSQKVTKIAVDFGCPQGITKIDDNGKDSSHSVQVVAQYRVLGETAWNNITTQTLTGASQTPQYFTFSVDVPEELYEVRAYKATGNNDDNRSIDTLQWISLRGYVEDVNDYGDMTLLATRMVATNALNSTTARKFYVKATSLLQTWDAVNGWSERTRTNSIAWAAADILRDPNYGRGLGTSRFNIQNLYRLHQVWEARGDKFNGVFDTKVQLWEALSSVVRCGRATPVYYAGVIDFVREETQSIVRAHFNPGLMVKDSFKATYKFLTSESPDHVIVEYTNPDTWKTAEVSCVLPGSTALNPYRVKLLGCTDRDQAWREGMSMAASNRDRRRVIEFTTLKAGLIPNYNALVRITHDVPQWGYFGRVLALDTATGKLTTTEPIPIDDRVQSMIAFRKRDGSEDGPYIIKRDPDLNIDDREFGCIIVDTQANLNKIYLADGYKEDFTHYQAGPTEARGIKALVTNVRPDSEGRTTITAINYAESVNTAENGGNVPTPPPESSLPGVDQQPIIDKVEVHYTVNMGEQNVVATAARGAIYYEFQARATGQNWMALGTADKPFLRTTLNPGNWSVRVRGVGRVTGPWTTWSGTIEATTLPTPSLTSLILTPKLFAIGVEWVFNTDTLPITAKIELYEGVTDVFANKSLVVTLPYPANAYTRDNLGPAEARYFWIRAIDTAGRAGPWYNNGVGLRGLSESDYDKVTEALIGMIAEEQLTQALQEKINTPQVDLGPVYAAIATETQQRTSADESLAQQQTVLAAGQEATAARVEEVNSALSNDIEAVGSQVNTVSAVANTAQQTADGKGKVYYTTSAPTSPTTQDLWIDTTGGANTPKRWNGTTWVVVTDKVATDAATQASLARADVQTVSSALAKTNGDLAAMYTIKTQITSNNITYIAGIGVGVENTGGIVSSSVTMMADKLVLLNPNTNTVSSPFMVVSGNTYIKAAFIQQATITAALIGATLSSVSTVASGSNAGLPVLTVNFNNGQTIYRGVAFTRVDSSTGTYMQDLSSGVKVLEWGDI